MHCNRYCDTMWGNARIGVAGVALYHTIFLLYVCNPTRWVANKHVSLSLSLLSLFLSLPLSLPLSLSHSLSISLSHYLSHSLSLLLSLSLTLSLTHSLSFSLSLSLSHSLSFFLSFSLSLSTYELNGVTIADVCYYFKLVSMLCYTPHPVASDPVCIWVVLNSSRHSCNTMITLDVRHNNY